MDFLGGWFLRGVRLDEGGAMVWWLVPLVPPEPRPSGGDGRARLRRHAGSQELEDLPDEAAEFAGHGDGHFVALFAAGE